MTTRVERLSFRSTPTTDEWTARGVLATATALLVIYSLALPLVLLDVWVWLYQALCFPLLGITPVARRHYFVLDRHRLGYLNLLEKANCVYCGYATGVIAFVREVTSPTEQYWCPIKHEHPAAGRHPRHRKFAAYGDESEYRRRLPALRLELSDAHAARRRTQKDRP